MTFLKIAVKMSELVFKVNPETHLENILTYLELTKRQYPILISFSAFLIHLDQFVRFFSVLKQFLYVSYINILCTALELNCKLVFWISS